MSESIKGVVMQINDNWAFADARSGLRLTVKCGPVQNRLIVNDWDFYFTKYGEFDGTGMALGTRPSDPKEGDQGRGEPTGYRRVRRCPIHGPLVGVRYCPDCALEGAPWSEMSAMLADDLALAEEMAHDNLKTVALPDERTRAQAALAAVLRSVEELGRVVKGDER